MPVTAASISATQIEVAPETAVYLDCNATTPIEPAVLAEVQYYLAEEYGNAGSRSHVYGQAAKERVNRAREEVAAVVGAQSEEVIFTSGATESDNLALLGLASHGEATGRRHIVSTQIEHKAILEPLEFLASQGFEVTLVPPTSGGWVDPDAIASAMRPDTLAVSVMAVNNETGVEQPIDAIALVLDSHDAYFHVDAAQAFGKTDGGLSNQRVDLLSVSGHKLYAPMGIGALVMRRRGYKRPPLAPLTFGGGQERGLRPGTLPVPLIAGLGTAASLAHKYGDVWRERCIAFKERLLLALEEIDGQINGDPSRTLPHTLNYSVAGVDSEAAMVTLKDVVALSNGSACTSQSYEPSHVLLAMGFDEQRAASALRFSWCHLTPEPEWDRFIERLGSLQG